LAALKFDIPIASVALVGATAKTLAQILMPTNQRGKVIGYGFFTDGVTSNAVPVNIKVQTQSTLGTGTTITDYLAEPELTETIQTTATGSYTVEPTPGTLRRMLGVPAFMGQYEVTLPQGEELIVAGGTRLGFTATAAAAVNVYGYIRMEE
jgi:hypothetical protein